MKAVELFAAAAILPAIWGWLVGRAATRFWPRPQKPQTGPSRDEHLASGGADYQI